MSIWLIAYLTVAVFALGTYFGAAVERGDRVPFGDCFSMGVLSALWPLLVAVFIFLRIKEAIK